MSKNENRYAPTKCAQRNCEPSATLEAENFSNSDCPFAPMLLIGTRTHSPYTSIKNAAFKHTRK